MPTTTTTTGHLGLPPKLICAWCDRPMGAAGSRGGSGKDSTSHGLCQDCIEQLLDSLFGVSGPPAARRRRPHRRAVRHIPTH